MGRTERHTPLDCRRYTSPAADCACQHTARTATSLCYAILTCNNMHSSCWRGCGHVRRHCSLLWHDAVQPPPHTPGIYICTHTQQGKGVQ